jgi:uncharacterized BrkB/YihY/UPF0761 family membrane protein
MVYCPKCGKKSEEGTKFCVECGGSLTGEKKEFGRDWDRECGEECGGRHATRTWVNFWVVVLVIVIIGIIFSIVIKIFTTYHDEMHMPSWMMNFPYWDICGLLVALMLVVILLSMIIRMQKKV